VEREKHFDALYHSIDDDGCSPTTYDTCISQAANEHGTYVINLRDIALRCRKQKKGKAIGL